MHLIPGANKPSSTPYEYPIFTWCKGCFTARPGGCLISVARWLQIRDHSGRFSEVARPFSNLNRNAVFFITVSLSTVFAFSSCSKNLKSRDKDATSAGQEVDIEGSISDDPPTEFVEAMESVGIAGVNLSTSLSYLVSGYTLEPNGFKKLQFQGTFAEPKFSFKSRVPSQYILLEVVSQPGGGKFGAVLPPAMGSSKAFLAVDPTTSIAAKMVDIIASKALAGDTQAQTALTLGSVAVSDLLMVAQSVRMTVAEQKSSAVRSVVDLTSLTQNLVKTSNTLMDAAAANWPPSVAGQIKTIIANKISSASYEGVFGQYAKTASAGILAFRVNPNLDLDATVNTNVAHAAIRESVAENMKIIDEAYRVQATAYRSASSLEGAVASETQVVNTFKVRFDTCISAPNSCAASSYVTPSAPLSVGNSSGSTSDNGIPVITIVTQPTAQTTSSGAANFSVNATVSAPVALSFQWQKQEGGMGVFTNISGEIGATINLSNLTKSSDDGDNYRVLITTRDGVSSILSNKVLLTVLDSSPGAPRDLVGVFLEQTADEVAAERGRVSLSWGVPENSGGSSIVDYIIEYKKRGDDFWTTYADGISIENTVVLADFPMGTTYDFRVRARNSSGVGVASQTIEINMPRHLMFSIPDRPQGGDWNDLSNWRLGYTERRPTTLPGPFDHVTISTAVATNSGPTPIVQDLTATESVNITVTVTGAASFGPQATISELNGTGFFYMSVFNGIVNGNASFSDATNYGTVNGNASFLYSNRDGPNSATGNYGVVTGTATFDGLACNGPMGTAGRFIPSPPPACE